MREMIWILVGAALLYAIVCAGLYAVQRSLLYFPEKGALAPADWGLPEARTVSVTTRDGLGIDSWHIAAADAAKPTIVLFHGNAGHVGYRSEKAQALAKAGYGVVLAGYRGYGANPGSPTEDGLFADGRAILDHLVGLGISGRKLVLYGESLGTGIAVRLATERRAAAVILEAPYTSITDVAVARYPFLPVGALLLDRFVSVGRIRDIKAPLLVIHGEADGVIPVRFGKTLFARALEPKTAVWLPGAGHNDLMAHGLMRAVLSFLGSLERPGGGQPPPTLDQTPQPRRNLPARR